MLTHHQGTYDAVPRDATRWQCWRCGHLVVEGRLGPGTVAMHKCGCNAGNLVAINEQGQLRSLRPAPERWRE